MSALVKSAVNDLRTRILLDTGANVSVISANYAKRLRLREVPDHGRSLEVRGINPGVLETRQRALVKITLGWERVYEFEMWIMNHSAGVDVILAYAESRDEALFERERELYEYWQAEQPPVVERREYPTPRNILTSDAEDSGSVEEAQVYCTEDMTQVTDTTSRECGRHDDSPAFRAVAGASDGTPVEGMPAEESEQDTNDALCTESSNGVTSENIGTPVQILDEPDDRAIQTPGSWSGRDAEENDVSEHLANGIELTDYAQELAFLPDLTEITVTALDYTGPNVQNKDLDVGQPQELVDVLKRHEKIMISSGNALPPPAYGVVPWASPIVIVLKKNGVDIRLCIDYKMVNAVTAIMKARTTFEADQESSIVMDAVSLLVNSPTGDMFANGEPHESSLVPVFDRRSFVDDICFGNETFDGYFLSHEVSSEVIRADPKKIKAVTEVPFPTSKKGMQSFLGVLNYYSRFIQDFAVYGAALYQLKDADFAPGGDLTVDKRSFTALQQKVMDAPILRHFDRDKAVHDAEMNYHPAEKEILALLLLLKVCYTQLAGRTIHVSTRFSTLDWVHKSKTLFGRTTQFAVMLSPWHLMVQWVMERDSSFAQLFQAGMDPNLLYTRLPRSYQGFVLSFDGSVTAASAYLKATTVNLAEYAGMNNGIQAALEHRTEGLVIMGDSILAIRQSLGVIACRKESLLTRLNHHQELPTKYR
ncbi:Hypothetical protein PHPALM_12464, partial [Phytophthora palmivora]